MKTSKPTQTKSNISVYTKHEFYNQRLQGMKLTSVEQKHVALCTTVYSHKHVLTENEIRDLLNMVTTIAREYKMRTTDEKELSLIAVYYSTPLKITLIKKLILRSLPARASLCLITGRIHVLPKTISN